MRVAAYPDAELLAKAAAELIASMVGSSPFSLGLAGGTTPLRTYERLREHDVPWERVDAFLADERRVPFDHVDSNAGSASGALFQHIPARLHPVPWATDRTPAEAAAEYEALIRDLVPLEDGRHRADLVLLGIGDDGHTASLFPGSEALGEDRRLFVENWVKAVGSWRLTATYPLLHAARTIVFLVAGSGKADAVHRILDLNENLPARRVLDGDADIIWLLDEGAASGMNVTPVERA